MTFGSPSSITPHFCCKLMASICLQTPSGLSASALFLSPGPNVIALQASCLTAFHQLMLSCSATITMTTATFLRFGNSSLAIIQPSFARSDSHLYCAVSDSERSMSLTGGSSLSGEVCLSIACLLSTLHLAPRSIAIALFGADGRSTPPPGLSISPETQASERFSRRFRANFHASGSH